MRSPVALERLAQLVLAKKKRPELLPEPPGKSSFRWSVEPRRASFAFALPSPERHASQMTGRLGLPLTPQPKSSTISQWTAEVASSALIRPRKRPYECARGQRGRRHKPRLPSRLPGDGGLP